MNRKLKRILVSMLFKIKNYPASLFSVKKLDYPKKDLFIIVDNFTEYNVRVNSCKKEPETVRWIEKFCSDKTVFYDVGANIGAYSLIAAANGARVYAFEPAYPNFCKLNENVSLNGLDDQIDCFPIALSVETKIGEFKYFETVPGTSKGYYLIEHKYDSKNIHPETEKHTLVYSMRDFVDTFKLPYPNMLKIDVDGEELDVIKGALEVLKNPLLRTMLVEIDDSFNSSRALLDILYNYGFKVESKHQRTRSIYNCILSR